MLEEADGRLADWVGTVLQGTSVSFAPPADEAEGKGVGLYLFEVSPNPPERSRKPPLQASLRYLVTTWAMTPQEAHNLLGELLFAAMEHPEIDVEPGAVSSDMWTSFGVRIQPSFVLRVPLRRERRDLPVKLVRGPLVVQTAALVALRGLVLGPGETPVAGARVEVPSLQLSCSTDAKGRFYFAALPAEPRTTRLRVLAKGHELTVAAERPASGEEPLVIRFGPLEDLYGNDL